MPITKLVCTSCKNRFYRNDLIPYKGLNYCQDCYAAKLAREKFSEEICSLFGIMTPGPRIWKQRKDMIAQYNYTDDMIILAIKYAKYVKKMQDFGYSIGIAPYVMDEAIKYYNYSPENPTPVIEEETRQPVEEPETTPIQVAVKKEKKKKQVELDPDAFLEGW